MAVLLGIDAGTTTVAAALYDTERQEILVSAGVRHDAYVDGLPPWKREQDTEKILHAIEVSIRRIRDSAGLSANRSGLGGMLCVDGISVTGQMHGYTMIRPGLPERFVTWEDRRILGKTGSTGKAPRDTTSDGTGKNTEDDGVLLDSFRALYEEVTPGRIGMIPAPGYAATGLYAEAVDRGGAGITPDPAVGDAGVIPDRSRIGLPPDTEAILSLHDRIVCELCGISVREAVTDPGHAHSTGLSLIKDDDGSCSWNRPLCEAIGIDRLLLPLIAATGSRTGRTSNGRFSLASGIPVYVGLGDNQASFLASVAEPGKTVLLNVGTGSQVSIMTDRLVSIPGIDIRPYPGSSFLLVGAPLCGGRAYAALGEFFRECGTLLFSTEIGDEKLYDRMEGIADIETSLEANVVFSGTRTDPDARGWIRNVSAGELTPGKLTGAVLNGIASELYGYYRTMSAERESTVASGNAVRKNPVLRKALSRMFGPPILVPRFPEEAALGAALTAGVGCGAFSSFEEASGHVRYERIE